MEAYSNLKMVECSIEAMIQFILLVIFTYASVSLPLTSGLGLIKDNNIYQWSFLAFSFLVTYVGMIDSILTAMNVRKNDQLGFKQKIVLGLSYTLQLLAHFQTS